MDSFFYENNKEKTDFPLQELKSIILAIDWEITDETLASLVKEVGVLAGTYENDKVIHTLLMLLKALGKYIKNQKSHAHPDTIKRLTSAYSTLEKLVLSDDLTQEEKEQALYEEVNQFKRLKKKIAGEKTTRRPTPPEKEPARKTRQPDIKDLVNAVKEMKSLMVVEFKSLHLQLDEIKKRL